MYKKNSDSSAAVNFPFLFARAGKMISGYIFEMFAFIIVYWNRQKQTHSQRDDDLIAHFFNSRILQIEEEEFVGCHQIEQQNTANNCSFVSLCALSHVYMCCILMMMNPLLYSIPFMSILLLFCFQCLNKS